MTKFSDPIQFIQSQLARIVYKNGSTIYGTFEAFDDYMELKIDSQYRFVPSSNVVDYKEALGKTGRPDLKFSIIVKKDEVAQIDYLRPK